MKLIRKLKKDGIKKTMRDIYQYQIDKYLLKFFFLLLKNKPLQDIIMIESHNDFDCNGGAFYNYLIQEGYNKRYKIVWLVKHPELVPKPLPENVEWVPEFRPSIKKNIYKCRAKWFSYDQDCTGKLREDQITIYLTHGSFGLKNCSGLIVLPEDLNYCLTSSPWCRQFSAKTLGWKKEDPRLVVCGYPAHDAFYDNSRETDNSPGELSKLTQKHYNKVVLWMPTFRKSIAGRQDCSAVSESGFPLIDTIDAYKKVNTFLAQYNMLLIIKIHPKQELSDIKLYSTANCMIISGEEEKRLKLNNTRLMKESDALISDYSSAAYDYLHVNRPIAYDLSDLESYGLGLIMDDPTDAMAGPQLKTIDDLLLFLDNVRKNEDFYYEERQRLREKIYQYRDGYSAKRVADLLGLKND